MNTKKIIITISAALLVLVLAVVGVVTFINSKSDSTGNPTASSNPTTAPTNLTAPTDVPEPVQVDTTTEEGQAQLAAESFPDVEGTEHFTKEEVQAALLTVNSYVSAATGTKYFMDGSFQTDGYPQDKVDSILKRYFTNEAWADFTSQVADREALVPEKPDTKKYINAYQSLFYFTDVNGMAPADFLPAACLAEEQTATTPCYQGAVDLSNFNLKETDDGSALIISGSAKFDPIYVVNGVEGIRPTIFNFSLYLTKNAAPDASNQLSSMLIDGYDGNNTTWEKWSPNA